MRIAGALKKRVQHRAIEEGRSVGEIITDALTAYLDAQEAKERRGRK